MLDRHVRYRVEEAVGWVTLDRPEAMNALSEEVFADLFDVVRAANDDPAIRVLIVTGTGPHFCAGGDLSWEQELDEAAATRLMRLNAHLSFELRHAPQPVIGAVRGWCLGGGNELQLHFDVTIASGTARFGWPETRWGALPFFYTPQLLPLIVGERAAREMLLFGRSYTAGQALEMGLINAVVPDAELEDEARRWAAELAVRSASALRLVKLGLNGMGDMLRIAANHEAGIVSKAVAAPGYQDEVGGFFRTDKAARPAGSGAGPGPVMTAPTLTSRGTYPAETIAWFYERGYWTSETLPDVLDRRAAAGPDRPLIIDGPTVLTNAQVREAAYRVAAGLRSLGVRAGDRIAVQLPNWPEYVLTYFALARLGAVIVPLMPIYRHKEVAYILGLTGATAYVGTAGDAFDHLAMVRELRGDLPGLKTIVTVRSAAQPGEVRYEDLAAGSGVPDGELLGPGPDPDAGHLIGFTSGTESQPKGCFHTWNSYSFTPRTQRLLYEVTPDDIALVVSPPTHTSGLAAGLLKPLVSGAAACLMPKWSPQEALRLIGRHRVTMATGATPFIAMLAEAYDPAVHDVSSFRMFLCGGAPVPAALIARVRQTLGTTKVLPVYGQTESLILTTCLSADTDERAATSSGRAVPGAQVAIVGPAGTPLPAGATGEIWYRTPGAMLGYWRNPEATAAAIGSDGWRHSGDLGYLDAAGYLQITGRIKDMIIRGGVNISSREVEEMLSQHPRVAAAAVVGVPDERLGERVGAFVVANGAEPTLAELTAFLQERFRLAKQKLPEVLHVLPELPMTATGKVSKQELRAQLRQAQKVAH